MTARAAYLRRLRLFHITPVYGLLYRLNLAEVGQQWGEGEWTARDLWRRGSRG